MEVEVAAAREDDGVEAARGKVGMPVTRMEARVAASRGVWSGSSGGGKCHGSSER